MGYAWKSSTAEDLNLEMQEASKSIQDEYAERMKEAQLSMDLNQLQAVAMEMQQKIQELS